ncbi:MAG: FAD-binding protein, partial [Candidatus Latescibacteria bacterium]|nr:FAD-binding protein [Candidatus Latescibacterota bacterium]
PHFSFNNAEQEGNELQSEYFVARHHAVDALKAVANLREHMAPILSTSEIRSVAADKLWLSTAYGQDVIGIHFNWLKDWTGVKQFLPILEAELSPFNPRPHWGKLFAINPEQIQAAYPRMADFQSLTREFDPNGKFRNAYVDRYILGTA